MGSFSNSGPIGNGRARSIQRSLLAIVTVIVVVAFLKWSASVTMPVAFALFLIAALWPVQRWLERNLPRGPATLVTLFVALLLIALFVAGIWYSSSRILSEAPRYQEQFDTYRAQVSRWLGADPLQAQPGEAAGPDVSRIATRALVLSGSTVGGVVLVLAIMTLGLHEAHDWRRKLERIWGYPRSQGHDFRLLDKLTADFQRYFAVRTFVGLIQAAVIWIVAAATGLEFAFTWAFLAFVLNYIPTIGSLVATFPPALWALVQFQSWGMGVLVLLLMGIAQLVCGNYIDPRLQGHYLRLSAVVVLVAVIFWGWVWGIGGAFISVPIMVAIVLICRRFERTRWIAVLLADWRERE